MSARPQPRIIEETRTGLYVFVTVETPWPVPVEDSPEEAHLLTWAEDNMPAWDDYCPINEARDEWLFRIEFDPDG